MYNSLQGRKPSLRERENARMIESLPYFKIKGYLLQTLPFRFQFVSNPSPVRISDISLQTVM
jgi:hypothetical protein